MNDLFHDAASVHVNVDPEQVATRLASPELLRALDDRLADETVAIRRDEDRVEVQGADGELRVSFRLTPEGEGTRLAALEEASPSDALDRTKRMLFPGRSHEAFETEIQRLRAMLEAMDSS